MDRTDEKSGISFVWKIDDFPGKSTFYFSGFHFKWPHTKSKWMLYYLQDMCVSGKENIIRLIKNHDGAPYVLNGTISVITADNIIHDLGTLKDHDFKENKVKTLTLMDLKEFQHGNGQFLPNHTLRLLIRLWDPNECSTIMVHHRVYSRYIEQNCSFQWNLKTEMDAIGNLNLVENVKEVPRDFEDFLKSETFSLMMTLLAESSSAHSTRKSSITVESSSKVTCFVKCNLDLVKENGMTEVFLQTGWMLFKDESKNRQCPLYLNLKKLKICKSIQEEIKLNCHVTVVTGSKGVIEHVDYISESHTSLTPKKKEPADENLPDMLYTLCVRGQYCDAEICIGDETFQCHKVVLCARSRVFQNLFPEAEDVYHIKTDEVDAGTFQMFLSGLYTGFLENMDWDCALSIYSTATKFEVFSLQKQCASFLLTHLTITNICEILEFVETYQELKKEVHDFFLYNAYEIILLPEWTALMSRNPIFAANMMQMAFLK